MPIAAGAARHMVVEMADELREVVGVRNGPGGRVVGAGVVAVTAKWGRNEGEGDAESVAIKELRFGVGQGGAKDPIRATHDPCGASLRARRRFLDAESSVFVFLLS